MLVHHADVQRRGIVGVVDVNDLTVLLDDACLRLVKAEEDAHKGGLTGTVLTQQGVDFSPAQLQGDVVVGNDAGKLLPDVEHFDYVLGLHNLLPSFLCG